MTTNCGLPITPEFHFLPIGYTVALLLVAGLFAVLTSWAVLAKEKGERL